MSQVQAFSVPHMALVARAGARRDEPELYLRLSGAGAPTWTADPDDAQVFASMREAARASLRLPGDLRAFALPRGSEARLH